MSKLSDIIENAAQEGKILDVEALVKEYPEMSVMEASWLLCHNSIVMFATNMKLLPNADRNSAGWEIIRYTSQANGPAMLLTFEDILSPFYNPFNLSPDIAQWIKEEALKRLEQMPNSPPIYREHWEKIALGQFPHNFKEQK